ncbi:MAG: YcbK family protein [Steroidobacteraceae bacterium]
MKMKWSRRRVLKAGALVAAASAAGAWARPVRAQQPVAAKRLALRNLHTPESLDLEFFRGDAYVPDALAAIQVLLRDYRNGEQHPIDPPLLDYLYDVALALGVDPVFSVISGYRSPQTNELLRESSSGVARRSLHLEGRAIDVRLAGVDCADLADRALGLSRGGVGYYRKSDFVHLDTGAFRTWRG